ncbi:MAG: hypothetical protein ACRCW1_10320 [Anaerotignaceae bacterium]
MHFISNVFVDEHIKNIDEIINTLKNHKPITNIFLICVENEDKNLVHILSSKEYFKKVNSIHNYTVVGIGKGEFSTKQLFMDILQYWLNKNESISSFKANIIKE